MPGKSNVYTLGEFGVNRVLSPVHLIDGELLSAQNADIPYEKGNRGLAKRRGMAKLNPAVAAGAILSFVWIPLPDPDPGSVPDYTPIDVVGTRLYLPTTSGANTYLTSTDGITWTGSAPFDRPAAPVAGDGLYNRVYQHGGFLSTTDLLYWVGLNAGSFPTGPLMSWDGATVTQVTASDLDSVFWGLFDVRGLHEIDGDVYATGEIGSTGAFVRAAAGDWDDSGSGDHSNGFSPWSETFATAFAWDRLWMPSGSQEMGYWPYAGGVFGAFVNQGIYTGNVGATMPATDMLPTPWGLIVTLDRNGQDPELVWLLDDPAGTWTDITPVTATKGCWGPMALFNGVLYLGRHTDTFGGGAVAYTGCELWSYDGATMTLVKDLTTVVTNANEIRSMVVFNGALYLTVFASTDPTHNVVRSADAITFTVPVAKNTADGDRPSGLLGFF